MFRFDDSARIARSSLLDGLPWLLHGFGLRNTAAADWPPPGTFTLKQVHSDIVVHAEASTASCEGDAMVTADPGLPVAIRTADCVPILLADPVRRVVAAVHAGWRGTSKQIVARTVARMRDEFGSDPTTIAAAIGPAIGPCCYEVSEDVAAQFAGYLPEWAGAGKTHLDLVEFNRYQLLDAGVRDASIDVLSACTRCDPQQRFESFRRDGEHSGRMHAVIEICS